MTQEEKSLTEQAAELRYPHFEDGNGYFNSVQNSRRGDFCDGAVWFAEHAKPLWKRMYEALSEVLENYEPIPGDKDDENLYIKICDLMKESQKIKINLKKFDKPTYPIV